MYFFKKEREIRLKKEDYCEDTQELITLFEQFISEKRFSDRKRGETIRGYISTFETFIKLCPEMSCKTINDVTINNFFKKLETRKRPVGRLTKDGNPIRTKTGIKNSTVATYRSKLNQLFNWLAEKNKLKINPFWFLPYPDVSYNVEGLSEKEIDKIFFIIKIEIDWKSFFIKKRNMAIFSILFYCGLRKGELISLKVNDIDFDERKLTVRAETSKSKRKRVIPLNSDVFEDIRKYMQERRSIESSSMSLFINEKGWRFTEHGLKHLVEKIKRVSKINCHLHRFRHTFAMNYLIRNQNHFALKQLMGHKDIKMTQAYIGQIPTDSLRKSMEQNI